ncbi:MAG: hypothetical protein H6620_10030 [Halobacteriovoraceae bacterium]|nr:hypothetical protein [Halobacteriovoraceae bacterium]
MSKNPKSRLIAPREYRKLTADQKSKIVNQCGPDGPLNSLVPSSLIGLDISEVCDIHDWMFTQARNSHEFKVANNVFFKNLKKKIAEYTSFAPLGWLQKVFAHIYHAAVRLYSMAQSRAPDKSQLDK